MKVYSSGTYLDPARVTGKRVTPVPFSGSHNGYGYGSKIPTPYLLQLDGKRWHRVYVVNFSNAGSAYVCADKSKLYLGAYDPCD